MHWTKETPPTFRPQIIELSRQLIGRQPDKAAGWLALANALSASGAHDEALACLADAIPRFPGDADLQYCQAHTLEARGDMERALEVTKALLTLAPSHRDAYELCCRLTVMLAPNGRVVHDLRQVTMPDDHDGYIMRLQLRAMYRDGAMEELLLQCDRCLALVPGDTSATYFKAIALAKLGRAPEARSVLSLDRLVEISMLSTPAGFPSLQAFCDQLAAEISSNRNFVRDPRSKATREGFQTHYLRSLDAPGVEVLLEQIKSQVEAYSARLGDNDGEFATAKPDNAKLVAWAIASDAEGHQMPHHHPSGWLSGVFYVQGLRRNNAFCGPLILGAVDEDIDPPWGVREIEPLPGRVVLFPSYVPHATLPPGVGVGRRIVVAFDVAPIQPVKG